VEIQVRLQRPVVEAERCTGCGICEHECPVSGLRAIRITAEGETRSAARSLLVGH
jgi:Pyruvate/2-oxoacid:ferredoxin oxidoreductase delta subunit